jgi:hypothetical protein
MAKYIEYKIVDDDELPPIVLTSNDDGGLSVVINHHHKIWLALNRNIIPSIMESFSMKLQEITDGVLKELYVMEEWDNE